ncbi:MAG TPA: CHAT domain-containing protein [Ktedonobacteraceae bacterium]|nr:CHAT domain-containing protein [Ktedonobacteraceae bacterium]
MPSDGFFLSILPSSAEALIGFELLPDKSLFARAEAASPLSLVSSLWASGIKAFDLRFVRTDSWQNMRAYLLCRIYLPNIYDRQGLYNYGQGAASHIQHIFAQGGYVLHLLTQEDVNVVRRPFPLQFTGEIRRKEDVFIFSQDFASIEFYITYPWEWYCANPIPYFASLLQQTGNWLVSIYLQPTHLTPLEERLMQRATSEANADMLLNGGAHGKKMYQVYTAFTERLEHPYLLRVTVASPNQRTLDQVSQIFLQQCQTTMPNQVLQQTRDPYERQAAERNICDLEWLPWGSIRDNEPSSARLRYLTDSKGASMVFHLPDTSTGKLKILVVLANPRDAHPLRLQLEGRLLEEAIRRSTYRDNFEKPKVLLAATINDLARALLDDDYHIVHIAAHGDAKGLLILEDELGNSIHVPQQPLANLFKRYNKTIRCVLLNACRGLAQGEKISLGISYTIAMEGSLDDQAALAFSEGFYDSLGAGREIPAAYEEGCSRASLKADGKEFNSRFFATP